MKSKVLFDQTTYKKIMYWVDKSDVEISGLGTIKPLDNGDILVTDAILCKQINTGTSTDIDAADISKAMFELKDVDGELRFWWHSHVNMSVFWSGTDTDTIKELGANGYFVSTVFNKKRETRTAIYAEKPYRIFVDEVETMLYTPVPTELVASWEQEFENKCKKKQWVAPTTSENKKWAWEHESSANESDDAYEHYRKKYKEKSPDLLLLQRSVPFNKWPESLLGDWVQLRDGTQMHIDAYDQTYNVNVEDPDVEALMETMFLTGSGRNSDLDGTQEYNSPI